MTKLEKSIRRGLKYFGPKLRAGQYGVQGYTLGDLPRLGYISSVHCDVEDGAVTDIRLYCVGDAQERRDYYGESINITEPITSYLQTGPDGWDWDALIQKIVDAVASDK